MSVPRGGVRFLTMAIAIGTLLVTASGYLAIGGVAGANELRASGGLFVAAKQYVPQLTTPGPVLAPDVNSGTPITTEGLTRALGGLLNDPRLGGSLKVSVMDVETGQVLLDQGAADLVIPASTTKIITATAVLGALGPYHRLMTTVVSGTSPGEVILVGAGDPTLSVNGNGAYPGAARLDRLAEQVKKAAGGPITKVTVDSTLFEGPDVGDGWDSDIIGGYYGAPVTAIAIDGARISPDDDARAAEPDLAAGQAFARLLGVSTDTVTRAKAPADAKQLGAISSLTIGDLTELMLKRSDNVLAEALLRQVAIVKGAEASFTGASETVKEVLRGLGIEVDGEQLVDGSGLSRKNRLSPAVLTSVLRLITGPDHPELRSVLSGLPVAKYDGTLSERFDQHPAHEGIGDVRAKTGTLSSINALSGVVMTNDGRQLAFAAISNSVPLNGGFNAEDALDQFGATLAACGCA